MDDRLVIRQHLSGNDTHKKPFYLLLPKETSNGARAQNFQTALRRKCGFWYVVVGFLSRKKAPREVGAEGLVPLIHLLDVEMLERFTGQPDCEFPLEKWHGFTKSASV